MTAKEFFKRFHWETVVPAALLFLVGILLIAIPEEEYLARSVSVGIFFVLSGATGLAAFFSETEENPICLLASVAQLSAALWMFITVYTPLYVFAIAAAVVLFLMAAGEILRAVKNDGGARRIVRIILSALFMAACVAVPCDPFGTHAALLDYTGSFLLLFAVYTVVMTCITGLFEEEEELVFRKVK